MTRKFNTPTSRRFRQEEFGTTAQFISTAGRGRQPVAVMLTCWEIGDAPNHLAHTQPNDLMVVQNAAGIVPAAEHDDGNSAVAALCYALSFPSVRHLIVCGHRDCRMIPMLLSDRRPDLLTSVRELLKDVRDEVETMSDSLNEDECRELSIEHVVLQQIRNLKTHAAVKHRLVHGDLLLHAWIYDDRRLTIRSFDPRTGLFANRHKKADLTDEVK